MFGYIFILFLCMLKGCFINSGTIFKILYLIDRVHYCGGSTSTKLGYNEVIPWILRKYSNFVNFIMYVHQFLHS